MAEKKQTVKINWKEYSIMNKFPKELLETLPKEAGTWDYIPVDIVRDMMRQIWWFDSPVFSDLIIVSKWQSNWGKDVILYKQKVTLMYNGKALYWEWYHPVTSGKMFSNASTWVFSTLRSKCLRDALKYEFAIFEYPWENDVEDVSELKEDEVKTEISLEQTKTVEKKVDKEKSEREVAIEEIKEWLQIVIDAEKIEEATELYTTVKNRIIELKLTPDEKNVIRELYAKATAKLKPAA